MKYRHCPQCEDKLITPSEKDDNLCVHCKLDRILEDKSIPPADAFKLYRDTLVQALTRSKNKDKNKD